MKTKLLFLTLSIACFAQSQIINIPDANLKAKLVSANSDVIFVAKADTQNFVKIDTNSDGEIQLDEAALITHLLLNKSNISDLTGLEAFVNLRGLYCDENNISTLIPNITLLELHCAYNNLTSLDLSNLKQIQSIRCHNNKLTSLILPTVNNIQGGVLDCDNNLLTSLNLDNNNLSIVSCEMNLLTNLSLKNNSKLEALACNNNQLQTLDLSEAKILQSLICNVNQLTILDLSQNIKLRLLNCVGNNLTYINLKNGYNFDGGNTINNFSGNPNLKYICADEVEVPIIQKIISESNLTGVNLNTYCSFVPGGLYNTIKGQVKFDTNVNGCDNADGAFSNIRVNITDGSVLNGTYTTNTGDYSFYTQEGNFIINPVLENPSWFSVSPNNASINFADNNQNINTQNFCVTPVGVHSDLEVIVSPFGMPANPGFDAVYKIFYRNKGNQIIPNSAISFVFDDVHTDFVSTTQAPNSQTNGMLTWDVTSLNPFESKSILVTLRVNPPNGVNPVFIDDILTFTATITGAENEETPNDNTFVLKQKVVGSYDPNDKTCLQGDIITPDKVGDYLTYQIRFENTGTYYAENVVVKDIIDTEKFDVSTFVPLSSSHPFVTRITNNVIEFIFDGIKLPFDDANNDGHVLFKIKTKPNLVVGNSVANGASIYFDFNDPIITNIATTQIVETLGVSAFDFTTEFNLYPNPTKDILNIQPVNTVKVSSIEIFNLQGQLILAQTKSDALSKIDVGILSKGLYILKVYTNQGTTLTKFLKE